MTQSRFKNENEPNYLNIGIPECLPHAANLSSISAIIHMVPVRNVNCAADDNFSKYASPSTETLTATILKHKELRKVPSKNYLILFPHQEAIILFDIPCGILPVRRIDGEWYLNRIGQTLRKMNPEGTYRKPLLQTKSTVPTKDLYFINGELSKVPRTNMFLQHLDGEKPCYLKVPKGKEHVLKYAVPKMVFSPTVESMLEIQMKTKNFRRSINICITFVNEIEAIRGTKWESNVEWNRLKN